MPVAHGAVEDGDRLVLPATSPRSWSAILVEHVSRARPDLAPVAAQPGNPTTSVTR